MKTVLRVVGVLLIIAFSTLTPTRGTTSYYCGRCVVHCWEEGTTTEYYFISPSDCCGARGLAAQCGGGAEWYPDMCSPYTQGIIC